MKPLWQQQQQQMQRQREQMRKQQEQMRQQQEQMRRQQMGAAWQEQQRGQQEQIRRQQAGADWLKQQSAGELQQEWEPQPISAMEEKPSCVARLAKTLFYLVLIGVVLVVAYVCVIAVLGGF